MGTKPSVNPVYDDKGNQIGVSESGPTFSQKLKGNKPQKKTETLKPKKSSKKK